MSNQGRRGGMGRGPMGAGEKAKDFKGTMNHTSHEIKNAETAAYSSLFSKVKCGFPLRLFPKLRRVQFRN